MRVVVLEGKRKEKIKKNEDGMRMHGGPGFRALEGADLSGSYSSLPVHPSGINRYPTHGSV